MNCSDAYATDKERSILVTVAAGYNSLVDPLTDEAISSPAPHPLSHTVNPVPATLRLTIRPRMWRPGAYNPFEEFCGLYHAPPVVSRRVASINFAKGTIRCAGSKDAHVDCDLNDERLYPSGTHLRGGRERADSLADLASAAQAGEVKSVVGVTGSHTGGPNQGNSDGPASASPNDGSGSSSSSSSGFGRPQRSGSAAATSSSRDLPTIGESDLFPNCTTGLGNLANTCFMNSMLQSLNAVPELVNFFLDQSTVETSLNLRNVLGSGGRVAKAFAGLLQSMHRAASPKAVLYVFPLVELSHVAGSLRASQAVHSVLALLDRYPHRFLDTLCEVHSQFSGGEQHDAMELFDSVTDILHEDLNRVIVKEVTEPVVGTEPSCWNVVSFVHYFKSRFDESGGSAASPNCYYFAARA